VYLGGLRAAESDGARGDRYALPVTARCLSVGALAAALLGCGPGTVASGNDDAGETTDTPGTGDSDESSESSETGEDPPMHCGGVTLVAAYSGPALMFVVDRSPSMASLWDHDGDPNTPAQTRWASVRGLLDGIAAALSSYAHVGLQQFPSAAACPNATLAEPTCADASACMITDTPELELTEEGMSSLLASLPPADAATEFRGASPAAAAYASAVAQLLTHPEPRVRVIVLITDGHLDCGSHDDPPANLGVPDPALLDLVAAAHEQEIHTLVIAVGEAAQLDPGPDTIAQFDPRPSLEALAQAGGLFASYLSVSDPGIVTHFESEDVIHSCAIELTQTDDGPPTPEQIPLITWTIDGVPIPYVEPDACGEVETGWTWIVEGEVVLFCGAACDAFHDGSLVEADYGCPDPI
jgi:hypothetical protein